MKIGMTLWKVSEDADGHVESRRRKAWTSRKLRRSLRPRSTRRCRDKSAGAAEVGDTLDRREEGDGHEAPEVRRDAVNPPGRVMLTGRPLLGGRSRQRSGRSRQDEAEPDPAGALFHGGTGFEAIGVAQQKRSTRKSAIMQNLDGRS